MNEKQHTNTETPKMTLPLTFISDGITNAVSDELRRASARHSNFEMGLPAPDDTSATDHFQRILDQLEVESIRVHTAMNEVVEAVRLGREKHFIESDPMFHLQAAIDQTETV